MKIILFLFMCLSLLGLALSIAAHIMALSGAEIPGGQLILALHVGIFVVWIPTVLISIRTTRYVNRHDFWKVALSGCPVWMRKTLYMLFAYAIFNFILIVPTTTNVLPSLGNATSAQLRGFSGHWMVFYAAAFAVLYSALHAPELFKERKCPLGHVVDSAANYCPTCGYSFSGNLPHN